MNGVQVLEPEQLQQRVDAEDLLLVQVTSADVYAQAHIANAVLVTPQELVCGVPPATGKIPPVQALTSLLSRIGYSPERDIVAYDDEGGGWAGRFLWTLDCIGHRAWSYLNGGLHSWHAAGLALEAGAGAAPTPSRVQIKLDASPIATIEDVLGAIEDPEQTIWDVRSHEEFIGARQSAARVGHIPGAINLDWMELKDPAKHLRITEGLGARLTALGISGHGRIITHCQTHHRSGLSYLVGRVLDLDIVAYDGSWSEWGNRDDTPIET